MSKPELLYELANEARLSVGESYGLYLDVAHTYPIESDNERLARESVARAALTLYSDTSTLARFATNLGGQLGEYVNEEQFTAITDPVGNTLTGDANHLEENPGDPSRSLEAIWATTKNLLIAQEHATVLQETVDGILMSGSNAWGPFFAPRATGEKPSDVDFLCIVSNIDALASAVGNLITADLVDVGEVRRLITFTDLYKNGRTDMYSLRSWKTGTETSIHFMPRDILHGIKTGLSTRRSKLHQGSGITVVRDFRPNTSGNVRKFKGYLVPPIDRTGDFRFFPSNEEVIDVNNSRLGYIAESPVGGGTVLDGETTYMLGVMPAFMVIGPAIIYDQDGKIKEDLREFRKYINQAVAGRSVTNLPGMERLPSHTLRAIRSSFVNAETT